MITTDKCKEFYLDGVTDAYVYPAEKCVVPVPFNVAQILSLNNCRFDGLLLRIDTAGNSDATAEKLTAKSSSAKIGNNTVFSFEISATGIEEVENLYEIQKKISLDNKNCYVVLKKKNGNLFLCYSLPGTFSFRLNTELAQDSEKGTLTITTSALSNFIPIKNEL